MKTQIENLTPSILQGEVTEPLIQQGKSLKDLEVTHFISIHGNALYEPQFFQSQPHAISAAFKTVTFVIGDSCDGPNVEVEKQIANINTTPEECEAEGIQRGSTWLKKNTEAFIFALKNQSNPRPKNEEINTPEKFRTYVNHLYQTQKINFEIVTFNEWRQRVEQTDYYQQVSQAYETSFTDENGAIYQAWIKASEQYAHRNLSKYTSKSKRDQNEIKDLVVAGSKKYFQNEGLFVVLGAALFSNIGIYAGKIPEFFLEIKRRFVDNKFPNFYGWDRVVKKTKQEPAKKPSIENSSVIAIESMEDEIELINSNFEEKTKHTHHSSHYDLMYAMFRERVLASNIVEKTISHLFQQQDSLDQSSQESMETWSNQNKHFSQQLFTVGCKIIFKQEVIKVKEGNGKLTEEVSYSCQIQTSPLSISPPKT